MLKDKIYCWLNFKDECVAFIVIKDPDKPENLWTVWSDDSTAFSNDIMDNKIKKNAWNPINFCSHCRSCRDGKNKIIFRREFDYVILNFLISLTKSAIPYRPLIKRTISSYA